MNDWAGICRFGGIGDNLIASAVLPALKKKYGKVEVITQEPQHVVFLNNPYIDKLSVHKAGDIPGEDNMKWQDWFRIRSKEYVFFANLSHSCESLRAILPGQTQYYWSDEWRRKNCGQNYIEAVADVCGVDATNCVVGFFPTEIEKAKAITTKREVLSQFNKGGSKIIGWVLTGTRIDKIYPYSAMAIARLIKELGIPVVMMGGPMGTKDFDMAKSIAEHVERQNGTLDGLTLALSPDANNETWPIRRVLSFAQHCDLVIGPDTGPMWSVSMCDIPKIMLMSHASPENITKYWLNTTTLFADQTHVPCWPCHRLIDKPEQCHPNKENNGAACISDITVETIIGSAQKILYSNPISTSGSGVGASPDPELNLAVGMPSSVGNGSEPRQEVY